VWNILVFPFYCITWTVLVC